MAERLAISVVESDDHPEGLEVRDALMQLLDTFALVTASAPSDDVRWCITDVRMNSPLTLVSEAVSIRAGVDAAVVARQQVTAARRNFSQLLEGVVPHAWSAPVIRAQSIAFLRRNTNGIGDTRIQFTSPRPSAEKEAKDVIDSVDVVDLQRESATLAKAKIELDTPIPLPVKSQIGSIDGVFLTVESYRNKPAFKIQDRRTKDDVWCIVSNENVARIVEQTNFKDVWTHSRVRVQGKLIYDANGRVLRIEATNVIRVEGKPINIAAIGDPGFTGELDVVEYLDRFREGTLG